ncbi:MAG: LacI family DNA-binding transcriptional regulator [Propionibacteriaceae bacterium]|nr:LacI family DNA-binding transcriptional regulator [Propionibacteriaceae bacterium]
MSKLPTSRDVARLAGVSQTTVSFVINQSRPVPEATRKRVLEAAESLGYQPHSGARALKNRRSKLLALVAPHRPGQDAAGQMRYIDAIARACRQKDYDVMLVTADEGTDGIIRVASTALCDAVLVMEVQSSEHRTAALSQIPIPAVMIGVPDEHEGLNCVDFDFEEAGARCTSLLAQAGHRRIGVVCETNPTILAANYTHRFARGVARVASELGLEQIDIAAEEGAYGADRAVKEAIRLDALGLIAMPPFPLSDLLHAMVANGIQPGKDGSAISFTERADLDSAPVAPTYLSMNREEAARQVVELALAAVDRSAAKPGRVHLVPPRLVEGHSLIGTVPPES